MDTYHTLCIYLRQAELKSKADQTIHWIGLKILERCLWTKIQQAKSSRESPVQAGSSSGAAPDPEQDPSARVAGGSSLKLISTAFLSLLGGKGGIDTLLTNTWKKVFVYCHHTKSPKGHLHEPGVHSRFQTQCEGKLSSWKSVLVQSTHLQEKPCTGGCTSSVRKLQLGQMLQVFHWRLLGQNYSWPIRRLQAAACNTILCGTRGPSEWGSHIN